jgi:EmrB/QacA subfamily drug resistance transporter
MTPQTMAVITRTFPAESRGAAMGLWGATSGVAMLVGPLAGGLLVDGLGWEWIFFVNIPVGIVGFVLAAVLVPKLKTHEHKFDMVGVFLSAAALFLIVFGLQEGQSWNWDGRIWTMIIAGVILLGLFIWQQAKTKSEALVPLELFRDRNFSASNGGIAIVGFVVTSMSLPYMFYLQLARGLTPTEAALLMVPMAIAAGVLSPIAGRILDHVDPRVLLVPGLSLTAIAIGWNAWLMRDPNTAVWLFLLPSLLIGIASAGMWGPLATTATRNLPPRQAGAGAGIYNTTRTVGSVLGSAAIAAFMQGRLDAQFPNAGSSSSGFGSGKLPSYVVDGFASAMAQTMVLPAVVMALGVIVVLFMKRPEHLLKQGQRHDWVNAETAAETEASA